MSVAFRRDSEEEHLEPRFELPIPRGPNLVTQDGMRLIGERVADFERRLGMTVDEGERAALLRDLRYWQTRQITAECLPVPSGKVVGFGTQVTIKLKGAQKTFRIVGDDESDPGAGTISFKAPLSRAVMGAEPGDWRSFGGIEEAIEVVAVSVPAP